MQKVQPLPGLSSNDARSWSAGQRLWSMRCLAANPGFAATDLPPPVWWGRTGCVAVLKAGRASRFSNRSPCDQPCGCSSSSAAQHTELLKQRNRQRNREFPVDGHGLGALGSFQRHRPAGAVGIAPDLAHEQLKGPAVAGTFQVTASGQGLGRLSSAIASESARC